MVVIFQKNLWPPFDEGEIFQEIVQPQFFEAEISIEISQEYPKGPHGILFRHRWLGNVFPSPAHDAGCKLCFHFTLVGPQVGKTG